jgi:hypothetical protein
MVMSVPAVSLITETTLTSAIGDIRRWHSLRSAGGTCHGLERPLATRTNLRPDP